MLFELRHSIDRKTLTSIYHAIFEPHLYYYHFFGDKIQIQLKDYLLCKRNPYGLCIFKILMLIHLLYS